MCGEAGGGKGGRKRKGGLHVCACAFAAALTFHPFKSLNISQVLKKTLGHIPAFSASQREKMFETLHLSTPRAL